MRDTIVYFPLESYPSRYTCLTSTEGGVYEQAFKRHPNVVHFHALRPWLRPNDITRGNVLDYATRTKWCAAQLQMFYDLLPSLTAKSTALFFEDFWTPGMEMVPYALEMEGKTGTAIYSFCHAQTPDPHDFTHPWKGWMRPFEHAWTNCHERIFCSSATMLEDWRKASMPGRQKLLPVGHAYNSKIWSIFQNPKIKREQKYVVFASRIAVEKNPQFFVRLAARMPDVHFSFLSGRQTLHGESSQFISAMDTWLSGLPNLSLRLGLTKHGYMEELQRATCLFNCADQDYVSYVLLDAVSMGADVLFPNHRSFTDALHNSPRHLYQVTNGFDERALMSAEASLRQILATGPKPPTAILDKYDFSVDRMIRVMTEDDTYQPQTEYTQVFDRPLSFVEKFSLDLITKANKAK